MDDPKPAFPKDNREETALLLCKIRPRLKEHARLTLQTLPMATQIYLDSHDFGPNQDGSIGPLPRNLPGRSERCCLAGSEGSAQHLPGRPPRRRANACTGYRRNRGFKPHRAGK